MADATSSNHAVLRRRLLIAGVAVALLAILALTPPLLNINRLQKRIVASISESLGRPVHIESASLHLLPVPGFTLKYIVVNEDPAFGFEPTIRADTVEASLRVSSLWRRQVEFSNVRFLEPSVNIVRNAAGRWNLESLLMHASRVDAAPTAQKRAGAQPRFPYIEATGARVNLKLGDEKMPFSLTESDFALWLPEPNQWHVRLVAKPSRTDANTNDPGIMRLEGAFERADHLGDVPVDLQASWHDVPLGEASRLVMGNDANWRGELHLDASLRGRLNNAHVALKATVDELRRADFVPPQMLDVSAMCAATFDATTASLHEGSCLVPDGDGAPLSIASPLINLRQPKGSALTINDNAVPLPWVFHWIKLFSQRVPAEASPAGSVAVHLERSSGALWTGSAALSLPTASKPGGAPAVFTWTAVPNPSSSDDPACRTALQLMPETARLNEGSSLTLNGIITACGYTLHAAGNAGSQAIASATSVLPMLEDGVAPLLPASHASGRVDITCSRTWTGPQTCNTDMPIIPLRKPPAHHKH